MIDVDVFDCSLITEYRDLCSSNEWNSLFQRIKNKSSMKTTNFECDEAVRGDNRLKNIYREVIPYDFNRFILSRTPKDGSDYINGSNIKFKDQTYIVTQYPNKKTIHLFWSMVWQSETQGIIMLGKVYGNDMDQYLPKKNDKVIVNDPNNSNEKMYSIQLKSEISFDGFVQRRLTLCNMEINKSMDLWHIEFWSWPDQGVPPCMKSFLTLLSVIRKLNIVKSAIGPPIVHCFAGAGRSGTFCLIDIAVTMMENDNHLTNVDIPGLMEDLRCQRMSMVSSCGQLKFCYEVVLEAFERYKANDSCDGSYLLCDNEPHLCANDRIHSSSSSVSEDAASDTVIFYQISDESNERSDYDDDFEPSIYQYNRIDGDNENKLDDNDIKKSFENQRLHRQEVISQRKLKNKEKIAALSKHLEDKSLKRFRLLSTITSTSLALLEEINSDQYRSFIVTAGAVLFIGTVFWLKYSPFKCS